MRKVIFVLGIFYTIVGLWAARGMFYSLLLYQQFNAPVSSGFILFLLPLVLGITMLATSFKPLKNKYIYPVLLILSVGGIIVASVIYYQGIQIAKSIRERQIEVIQNNIGR